MGNTERFVIRDYVSILEALKVLNRLPSNTLTLFIVDENDRMVGTLTDGDIRRSLISGAQLNDPVSSVMFAHFRYVKSSGIDGRAIRELKKLQIALVPCLDDEHRITGVYNLRELRSVLPVDAVLMAGGKGERLRPLTEKTPKPLLKVGDKCIIDYNVERLISYGIDRISVTVNYLAEQIEAHFSKLVNDVQVNCVREPQFWGTMGSLTLIDSFYNDTILLMNSDLFTNIDYEDFYLHHIDKNADLSVAAVPYLVSVPYAIFKTEAERVLALEEKPTYNYYANAGIYLIKKRLLELMPRNTFYNATDFIDLLIKKRKRVVRFPITGNWIDIGKPEDYKRAQDLARHIEM